MFGNESIKQFTVGIIVEQIGLILGYCQTSISWHQFHHLHVTTNTVKYIPNKQIIRF